MKIKLLIKHKTSQIVDLAKSYCVMGRAEDADVSLSDSQCSKQHAVIYEAFGGELKINDLNSTNGTFVNGKQTTESVLKIGDRIEIGKTVILILDFSCLTNKDDEGRHQTGSIQVEKTVFRDLKAEKAAPEDDSDVILNGPEKIFKAIAPKLQKDFLDYVDTNGTRTRTSVDKLMETKAPPLKKVK